MLDTFRSATRSWIVRGFFLVLALSFGLFWGIQDIVQDIFGNPVLVQVGPRKITWSDLEQSMHWETQQAALLSGRSPAVNAKKDPAWVQEMLVRLIRQTLIELEAERVGFVVPDAWLRTLVHDSPMFRKGRGFDRNGFLRWLRTQGLTENQFINGFRKDILRTTFVRAALSPMAQVPSGFSGLYGHALTAQRQGACVSVPFDRFPVQPPADPSVLEMFLSSHSKQFVFPEVRAGFAVLLDRTPDLSDEAFGALGDEAEKRLDQGASPDEIRRLAPCIQIIPFAAMDDKGRIRKPGQNPDSGSAALLPARVVKTVFATDAGQASSLVTLTKDRAALVRVEDVQEERPLTLAEARASVEQAWRQDQQKKQAITWGKKIQQNGSSLESQVRELGLGLQPVLFHAPEGRAWGLVAHPGGRRDPSMGRDERLREQKAFATPLGDIMVYARPAAVDVCRIMHHENRSPLSGEARTGVERWIRQHHAEGLVESWLTFLARQWTIRVKKAGEAVLEGHRS